MKPLIIGSLVLLLFLCTSCGPQETESSTKGKLQLTIPESILPVMRAEVEEFLRLYGPNGADIRYDVGTTESAARAFILDTPRVVFLTRRLTEAEQRIVRERSGDLQEVAVAQDGIAVIAHRKNPVTEIAVREVRSLLQGTSGRWENLRAGSSARGKVAVYLQDSSDVLDYLRQRILDGRPIRVPFKRTGSSEQTIRSVAGDPLAIGFVGIDWIDSVKAEIKVLAVSQSATDVDTSFHPPKQSIGTAVAPHAAYLYRGDYPLKRIIYMYTKSTRTDLATGFATFVAGNEGQRLILSRNLVPGTRPIRLKSSLPE